MENKTELFNKILKKKLKEVKSYNKVQAIQFLIDAGIFDKSGKFSKNYPALRKWQANKNIN